MASQARNADGKSTKRPNLKYFFLNGQLHQKLSQNRGKDTLTAWNYPESRRAVYSYTAWLKRHEKAFTTVQVCKMVNRSRRTLEEAIKNGMIERPQFTYGLTETRKMHQYMWSEKDIFDLLDYLSTLHRGRPRKDGLVSPQHLPTPTELRAMINSENFLFVKDGDRYIPSWRAKEL